MKKNNIYFDRSDLNDDNILKNHSYKTLHFNSVEKIKCHLKKEILFFLNKHQIKKGSHIFIVGLGNDNFTADSIGPKSLKHIKANAYTALFNSKSNTLVSLLEPGVLGETGIKTSRIIESVVDEIKPDIVVLIDSFVSNDINDLNKTIEINDTGISTGSGILGLSSNISYETLNIPVLVIGVVSAVEIKFKKANNNYIPYLLSTKDVDDYILNASKTIGESLNEVIDDLA